ncbi:MAG: PKD domain-containing protein [Planctomycetota bacterium]|jgi:PKD repeat protein
MKFFTICLAIAAALVFFSGGCRKKKYICVPVDTGTGTGTDTSTGTATGTNLPPSVGTVPDQTAALGQLFAFDVVAAGNVSDDRDTVAELTFAVTSGGGSFAGQIYMNTFVSAGSHAIDFTVTDSDAASSNGSFTVNVFAPPIASFSANTTAGEPGLAVQFTDESLGCVTSWEWDFDCNGTADSTEQNPQFTYDNVGTYSVSLKVTGPGGTATRLEQDYIAVVIAPVADFFTVSRYVNSTAPVTFTDTSTGDIDSWEWDFENDGIIDSFEQNPVHSYTASGNYTVSLTVGNKGVKATRVRADYIEVNLLAESLVWAKRAGGENFERGYGISAFPDGSTIVTGYFGGNSTFGNSSEGGNQVDLVAYNGTRDLFIAKYNHDGTLVWAKRAGGGGTAEDSFAVCTFPDGSSIITGRYSGDATFGNSSEGGNQETFIAIQEADVFIAKYNPDGTLAWAKSAGGTKTEHGCGIAALTDGSAIITGWFNNDSTFGAGEGNETVLNSTTVLLTDIFIAKYNPGGTLAWAKSAGGTENNKSYAISTFPDGSAIITGEFEGTSTFGNSSEGGNQVDITSSGGKDIFVAKYNPDGTLAWAKKAGGTDTFQSDTAWGISALPDGSAIVTGQFDTNATFGNSAEGGSQVTFASASALNFFIAKYNPDGTLAWVKEATETGGGEVGNAVSVLADGSAIVTGFFGYTGESATFGNSSEGGSQVTLTSAGGNDIFIAKYNPDGTLAWAEQAGAGGTCDDRSFEVSALPDGSAIITGSFQGIATFGLSEANETDLVEYDFPGGADFFIARFYP